MKKYKILIIIVIFAGVIFLAGKLLTGKKPDGKNEEKLIKVKRGDISVSVNLPTIIKPGNVVEIKSKVKGKVVKMPAKKGKFLEAGALVAEIENTFTKPAVEQALAELDTAKARSGKIKAQFEAEKGRNQRSLKTAEDNLEKAKQELQKAVEKEKMKEALKKNNIETESELIKQEVDVRFTINEIQEKISKLSKNKPVPAKEIESLKASLESAKSEYALVLQYLELTKKPVAEEKIDEEKYGIKQAELELAKAEGKIKEQNDKEKEVTAAESEVLKKQEALKIAEDNLRETIITAPISGVILRKDIEEGGFITPEMLLNSTGALIASITNLENVYININVNEKDVGEIKTGQAVKIIADIFPKNIFEGRIIKVTPKKVALKKIKLFEVTVEIVNLNALLLPEMNAALTIIIKEAKNVLLLPNDAIQNGDDRQKVLVIQDGKPIQREIKTGLKNRDSTEIISGLKEGEIIIKPGKIGRDRYFWNIFQ